MSEAPPSPASPSPSPRRGARAVGAIVVVAVLVIAAAYVAGIGPFARAPGNPGYGTGTSGGFTDGQVVSLPATGNFQCTPSGTSFYAGMPTGGNPAACEAGAADASAVADQTPQWALVPAFAGLTVFGGNADGYPSEAGTSSAPLLTDCGVGGSSAACVDNPATLYFDALRNLSGGGSEAMPAHDLLLNTSTTWPNVPWGTIFVFVFDPYIFPNRTTGACDAPGANASNSANCLTSVAALGRALATNSTDVAATNGCSGCHDAGPAALWASFHRTNREAVELGAGPSTPIDQLDSNLYVPYSVQPGAPAAFP